MGSKNSTCNNLYCLKPYGQGINSIYHESYDYKLDKNMNLVQTLKYITDSKFDYFKESEQICTIMGNFVDPIDKPNAGNSYKEFIGNIKTWLDLHNAHLKLTSVQFIGDVKIYIDVSYLLFYVARRIQNNIPANKILNDGECIIYYPQLLESMKSVNCQDIGSAYQDIKLETENPYVLYKNTNESYALRNFNLPNMPNDPRFDPNNKIHIGNDGILMLNDAVFKCEKYNFDNNDLKEIMNNPNHKSRHKLTRDSIFTFKNVKGQYRSKWCVWWIRFLAITLVSVGIITNLVFEYQELHKGPEKEPCYYKRQFKYIACVTAVIFAGLYWFKDLHQSCLDIFKTGDKYSWQHIKKCTTGIKICEMIGFCCCNKTYINDPEEFDLTEV